MIPDLDSPGATIGVIGAGAMGRGIAQVAAAAGYSVLLTDLSSAAAEDAAIFVAAMLRRAAEKGLMSAEQAEAAIGRLQLVSGIRALKACEMVVEAIVEDLDAKRKLFAELEAAVSKDCILASNTSALSITAIAVACKRPERVVGAHFFNPVPLMKLVEIIDGENSDPAVGDAVAAFVARIGHRGVRVKDAPLFLVNHVGRGYSTESLAILEEGAATPFDIDRVMIDVAGFRMGPFELFDLTALDVSHRAMESSFDQFYGEPRLRPSTVLNRRMNAGLFGRKSGRGFYSYSDGKIERPEEPPAPSALPTSVWISSADTDGFKKVHTRLEGLAGKIKIEPAERPSRDALTLITPLGNDATTQAVAENLDPARTIAVDTLLGLETRVTLMTTPATTSRNLDDACALFAAAGSKVTAIADCAGFIAPRILASLVNIACVVAQQGIGTPDDIDEAVRIGRGYRKGPLTLGDEIGPGRILTILQRLYHLTGDPRYRPSPWLRRRVQLGLSLKAPDAAS